MASWSNIYKFFKIRLITRSHKKGKLPLGPEHKKFKNKIVQAQSISSVEELLRIMGKPDKIEECELEDRISGETGELSDEYPEKYLIYIDPWRPRVHYRFGVSSGQVIEFSGAVYAGCKKCNAPLIDNSVCSSCGFDNTVDGD